MTKQYFIETLGGMGCKEVSITAADFDRIKQASLGLYQAFLIEEKYEVLLENYKELERSLVDIAMEFAYSRESTYDSSMRNKRLVARRVANLLSSCRTFIDQVKGHVRQIVDRAASKRIVQMIRTTDDSSVIYRLMEQLRNTIQHSSIPISVSPTLKRGESVDRNHCTCYSTIQLSISSIKHEDKLTEIVREAVTSDADSIDITPYIRIYLDELSQVVYKIREEAKLQIQEWENAFAFAEQLLPETARIDPNRQALYLVSRMNDAPHSVERFYVSNEMLQHRQSLVLRSIRGTDLNLISVCTQPASNSIASIG